MLFTCLQLLSRFPKLHLKANKLLRGKFYSLLELIAVIKWKMFSHCQFLRPGKESVEPVPRLHRFAPKGLQCAVPVVSFRHPLLLVSLLLLLLLLLVSFCEGILESRAHGEVVKRS